MAFLIILLIHFILILFLFFYSGILFLFIHELSGAHEAVDWYTRYPAILF